MAVGRSGKSRSLGNSSGEGRGHGTYPLMSRTPSRCHYDYRTRGPPPLTNLALNWPLTFRTLPSLNIWVKFVGFAAFMLVIIPTFWKCQQVGSEAPHWASTPAPVQRQWGDPTERSGPWTSLGAGEVATGGRLRGSAGAMKTLPVLFCISPAADSSLASQRSRRHLNRLLRQQQVQAHARQKA